MIGSMRRAALVGALLLTGISSAPARDDDGQGRRADQEALKPYAGLVGSWRGAGQVRRGSTKGAWTEQADWSWKLTPESAALEAKFTDGKHLSTLTLRPADQPGAYRAEVTYPEGSGRTFVGKPGERNKLVLDAEGSVESGPVRLTLTPLHDTRFLMLIEAGVGDSNAIGRLGEVGYTRKGVAFAVGDSYPACLVTGGRGTIEVKHEGQSYWVCCSGCKELFDADPAAAIAESEAKAKEPRR